MDTILQYLIQVLITGHLHTILPYNLAQMSTYAYSVSGLWALWEAKDYL